MPSLVLMENAGRQVVAADRGGVRRTSTSARWRCCAAAATTAATASSSRGRMRQRERRRLGLPARAASRDVRGDARVNLEILGRLGLPVVEIAGEQALGAALVGGSRLHADRRCDVRDRA